MKFNITRHCKERYVERVLGNTNIHNNVIFKILNDLKSGKNITSQISTNFPRFVLYLKERYGSNKGYTIILNDHTLFILTKRKGTINLYDVMTCYIEHDTFRKFSNTALTTKDIHLKLSLL